MGVHSPVALAFLRCVIDLVTRARLTPAGRAACVVILESGARPRILPRADFARELRSAGLDGPASIVMNRRVAHHEILVWITSDAETGEVVIPVLKPPKPGEIALPTDDVITSLLGQALS